MCIGEKDAAEASSRSWPCWPIPRAVWSRQFQRFADEFATLPAEQTRASTLPLALPI